MREADPRSLQSGLAASAVRSSFSVKRATRRAFDVHGPSEEAGNHGARSQYYN